jgi:hypothetical protein
MTATASQGQGPVVYESPAATLPEHIKRITRAVQLVGQRQGITLRAST